MSKIAYQISNLRMKAGLPNLVPRVSHCTALAPGGSKMRDPGDEFEDYLAYHKDGPLPSRHSLVMVKLNKLFLYYSKHYNYLIIHLLTYLSNNCTLRPAGYAEL